MSLPLVTIFTGNSNSGKYCIEELFKRYPDKSRVRGVFRSEEKSQPFREKYPHLEIVTGCDASKPETLKKAFFGAQAALIFPPFDPKIAYSDETPLTETIIESAVSQGVQYIVIVSSSTISNYEHMPLCSARYYNAEQLLERLRREKGIKFTSLRGGSFMENLLHSFKKVKADSVFFYPNVCVPNVDTRDIGMSAAACLASSNYEEHDGKYYEMAGPEVMDGQRVANKCLAKF